MATIAVRPCAVVSCEDDYLTYPADKDTAAGDLLALVNEKWTKVGDPSDPASYIMAIAACDAKAGEPLPAVRLSVDTHVEFNVMQDDGFGGAADHVLAATDLGNRVEIRPYATGTGAIYVLAADQSTNPRVVIERLAEGSEIGDTNARVIVRFLDALLA